MSGVEHANLAMLLMMATFMGLVIYYIKRAASGAELFVRRIPGIDAIDEAAGRAAELGRPLTFSTGLTSVGPTLYACLGVLSYVARKSARYKTRMILPQYQPEVMAICEDVYQEAYRQEGKLNLYDSRNVVYLSDEQFAFAAGYMGLLQRERVGAALLFGNFAAESLILAEAGQQVGAMQVAASVSPEQVAFFICTCDYTLIGEELYAASSYLTKEPVQLGSLYGQDRAKLLFFTMIIAGCLIATLNSVLEAGNYDRRITNLDHYIKMELW
jgi:hypothetical protein